MYLWIGPQKLDLNFDSFLKFPVVIQLKGGYKMLHCYTKLVKQIHGRIPNITAGIGIEWQFHWISNSYICRYRHLDTYRYLNILLMEEILHELIESPLCYLQGFIHPRWCRIFFHQHFVECVTFLDLPPQAAQFCSLKLLRFVNKSAPAIDWFADYGMDVSGWYGCSKTPFDRKRHHRHQET